MKRYLPTASTLRVPCWRVFSTLLLAGLALLLFTSCKKEGAAAKPANVDYYTCTMHPSVKKQNPTDKCPICSMDLTPVFKKSPAAHDHSGHTAATNQPADTNSAAPTAAASEDKPTEFTVSVERQQQIGVTYATIEKRPFVHAIRSVAMVAYDKKRHWDYVTRVEGYVKELFVFSRGELVEKGAPLVSIYSPDLLTGQSEFVNVLKMRDEARTNDQKVVLESTERLVESAKQRLRLWNISEEQIALLEKTRKPQELLTLSSPFKGVVQDIGVDQG